MDDGVRIQIIPGDDVGEYNHLVSWINDNRELRGRVARITGHPADGRLGGIIDAVTVALGAGGAVAALAPTLTAWLRNRRSAITITFSYGDRTAQVIYEGPSDARSLPQQVQEIQASLEKVLKVDDEP